MVDPASEIKRYMPLGQGRLTESLLERSGITHEYGPNAKKKEMDYSTSINDPV